MENAQDFINKFGGKNANDIKVIKTNVLYMLEQELEWLYPNHPDSVQVKNLKALLARAKAARTESEILAIENAWINL